MQRKTLTPNDFLDLGALTDRLLAFTARYREIARPLSGPSPDRTSTTPWPKLTDRERHFQLAA